MKGERKYHISRSASGWYIYDAEGKQVCACFSRINALETLYELMGWNKPQKWD